MFKKFSAWVKGLFVPVKIEETRVDEFIEAQKKRDQPLPDLHAGPFKVKPKLIVRTPHKSLDEKIKDVDLPVYAQGKTLPPKAKRQFIEKAKTTRSQASVASFSEGYGNNNASAKSSSPGIDPLTAGVVGYTAGSSFSGYSTDESSPVINHSNSSSSESCYSSSSSSSSYDSGSYDSGSSYSSCD